MLIIASAKQEGKGMTLLPEKKITVPVKRIMVPMQLQLISSFLVRCDLFYEDCIVYAHV